MSNTSIAAPAICLFFNTLIKACSSTIGPRDVLINQAVVFILSSSAAPTRPRVRLLNTKWIVRIDVHVIEQDIASNENSLSRNPIKVLTSPDDQFWTNSVIIEGVHEVMLVDAQLTKASAERVLQEIKETKKPLSIIYITHAHADHFLGLEVFKEARRAWHGIRRGNREGTKPFGNLPAPCNHSGRGRNRRR
jgi:hypothetical protein